MAKLRLTADSYDQRQKDDTLVPLVKGDTFDPVDKAEEDRLKDIGAAESASAKKSSDSAEE